MSKHQSFLSSIHSYTQGRGETERDVLSHMSFIPFYKSICSDNPAGKVSVVFQAALDKKTVAPESARAILHERYNRIRSIYKGYARHFL